MLLPRPPLQPTLYVCVCACEHMCVCVYEGASPLCRRLGFRLGGVSVPDQAGQEPAGLRTTHRNHRGRAHLPTQASGQHVAAIPRGARGLKPPNPPKGEWCGVWMLSMGNGVLCEMRALCGPGAA